MPIAQIPAPNAVWGMPLVSGDGINDQGLIEVVNNSGAALQHGDVCTWDTTTALSAVSTTSTGAQQLSTTATSYAVADSSAFGTSGPIVATLVLPTSYPNTVNLLGQISAKADGTHITIAFARAGAAGSLPAGTILFVPPSSTQPNYTGAPFVGLPTAPGDSGRGVTLSTTAVAGDPLIAGVVSIDGSAGTSSGLILPGQPLFLCVDGVARVQIGGGTVAAGALLRTAGTNPGWALGSGTLGNLLGIALEAQTAKDANNTIRAAIKLG